MSLGEVITEILTAQQRIAAEFAFPIRAVLKDGQEGFAIHALNAHSRTWQPVGLFQSSYIAAIHERDELLDLLEESQLGRPGEARPEYARDAAFAALTRSVQA